MKLKDYGYVRVAAASIETAIADPEENGRRILEAVKKAHQEGVEVLSFAELSLSGFTCAQLFHQHLLLHRCQSTLKKILEATREIPMFLAIGLPLLLEDQLFNVAAISHSGKLLAFVPWSQSGQMTKDASRRWFSSFDASSCSTATFYGEQIPLRKNILFCDETNALRIAVCVGEDLCIRAPLSYQHSLAGANLLLYLCAEPETAGASHVRTHLAKMRSESLHCALVYAGAGMGESTTDHVYSGHCLIAEGEEILDSIRFATGPSLALADVDVEKMDLMRLRTHAPLDNKDSHQRIHFVRDNDDRTLLRSFNPTPFLPLSSEEEEVFSDIVHLQATAYMQRMKNTSIKRSHLGFSAGLDSTWALIIAQKAHELLGSPKENIECITMPGFGTTEASHRSAHRICALFEVPLREISIIPSTLRHFEDIGHDPDEHTLVFENAQARERTKILMDLANKEGGLVIGTGDLSEIALGWSTYNGDHMSSYALNASVPKTLLRALLRWYANKQSPMLRDALLEVLERPITPELLPLGVDGEVLQKTEDIIGEYVLNDFFLYQAIGIGFSPAKVLLHASLAFSDYYSMDELLQALQGFLRRFISQQFKRNTAPDSAAILRIDLSSRTGFPMPSDASSSLFYREIERLAKDLE